MKPKIKNFVWIDLEFSGPDIRKDNIIEIAVLITDSELNILDEKGFTRAIKVSEYDISRMDPWVIENLGKNALIEECKKSKLSKYKCEKEAIEYISQFCKPQESPLCGNSVGYDRMFLEKDMWDLSHYLHYRNIDVSSFKELYKLWVGELLQKKRETHRALDDIRESIEEMKFYKENFLKIIKK